MVRPLIVFLCFRREDIVWFFTSEYSNTFVLFLVFGVEADGGWTVVDKADIHHCAKFASAYRLAECGGQFFAELLIERY